MIEVGKDPQHQKSKVKVKVRDARESQGCIIYISYSKFVEDSFLNMLH
jgi:hypothetical protein